MCELCFVNTGSAVLNRTIGYAIAYVDGCSNRDGVGFYTKGKLWKSQHAASLLVNFYPALRREVRTKSPIILHTRFATPGVNNLKNITEENAHPFETERFVLAHNGTLTFKTVLTKAEKDFYGDITDSEFFLRKLTEKASDNFVESFNTTMEMFTGKFAFLIYDKKFDTHYAIRGSTAPLHWVPLVKDGSPDIPYGFVINTQKEDLVKGLILANNLTAAEGIYFDFEVANIVELAQNTIYNVDGAAPLEVGKTKENFQPATQVWGGAAKTYYAPQTGVAGSTVTSTSTTTTQASTSKAVLDSLSPGAKFANFMLDADVNLSQVDLILENIFGRGLAELMPEEAVWCDNYLVDKVNVLLTPRKRLLWSKIKEFVSDTYPVYAKLIRFPYFLEAESLLQVYVDKLEKEAKHASKADAGNIVFNLG